MEANKIAFTEDEYFIMYLLNQLKSEQFFLINRLFSDFIRKKPHILKGLSIVFLKKEKDYKDLS
mgnify:FL=1